MKMRAGLELRRWLNWNHLYFNKGQSLLELAVFGSILLFVLGLFIQYGMRMNYQQRLQMQTFRKALKRASEVGGTYRYVTWLTLEDKPLPEAQGQFGIASRSPYSSAASGVWSQDLYAEFEYGKEEDLPRIELEINQKRYTFTTAAYRECSCSDNIKKKEDDEEDKYLMNGGSGSDGIYWYWKAVACDGIQQFENYDLDADDKEELVLEIDYIEVDGDGDGVIDGEEVDKLKVIDYQEGDIDLTLNTKDKRAGKEEQGLRPDYTKKEIKEASLNKKEDSGKIITTTSIDITEKFYHPIVLNKITDNVKSQVKEGDILDEEKKVLYVYKGFQRSKTTSWSTPH